MHRDEEIVVLHISGALGPARPRVRGAGTVAVDGELGAVERRPAPRRASREFRRRPPRRVRLVADERGRRVEDRALAGGRTRRLWIESGVRNAERRERPVALKRLGQRRAARRRRAEQDVQERRVDVERPDARLRVLRDGRVHGRRRANVERRPIPLASPGRRQEIISVVQAVVRQHNREDVVAPRERLPQERRDRLVHDAREAERVLVRIHEVHERGPRRDAVVLFDEIGRVGQRDLGREAPRDAVGPLKMEAEEPLELPPVGRVGTRRLEHVRIRHARVLGLQRRVTGGAEMVPEPAVDVLDGAAFEDGARVERSLVDARVGTDDAVAPERREAELAERGSRRGKSHPEARVRERIEHDYHEVRRPVVRARRGPRRYGPVWDQSRPRARDLLGCLVVAHVDVAVVRRTAADRPLIWARGTGAPLDVDARGFGFVAGAVPDALDAARGDLAVAAADADAGAVLGPRDREVRLRACAVLGEARRHELTAALAAGRRGAALREIVRRGRDGEVEALRREEEQHRPASLRAREDRLRVCVREERVGIETRQALRRREQLDLVVSLEKKPYRADAQTHAPAREVALAPRVDDEDDVRDRRVVEAPRRARERLGGSARRVDEEEQVPALRGCGRGFVERAARGGAAPVRVGRVLRARPGVNEDDGVALSARARGDGLVRGVATDDGDAALRDGARERPFQKVRQDLAGVEGRCHRVVRRGRSRARCRRPRAQRPRRKRTRCRHPRIQTTGNLRKLLERVASVARRAVSGEPSDAEHGPAVGGVCGIRRGEAHGAREHRSRSCSRAPRLTQLCGGRHNFARWKKRCARAAKAMHALLRKRRARTIRPRGRCASLEHKMHSVPRCTKTCV
mmetsp:Transcript_36458/g.112783  ORF Transcript_36458/g.112783 Transcript_36458/m.112783 type:complete len:864 (+) Transcript_36458:1286-3877(+)